MEFLTKTGREGWGANIWPESGGRPDPARLDWPVTRVTYHEAVEFAAWRGCCLPDESQLEWAARGPNGLKTPSERPARCAPRAMDATFTMSSLTHSIKPKIWSQPIFGLYRQCRRAYPVPIPALPPPGPACLRIISPDRLRRPLRCVSRFVPARNTSVARLPQAGVPLTRGARQRMSAFVAPGRSRLGSIFLPKPLSRSDQWPRRNFKPRPHPTQEHQMGKHAGTIIGHSTQPAAPDDLSQLDRSADRLDMSQADPAHPHYRVRIMAVGVQGGSTVLMLPFAETVAWNPSVQPPTRWQFQMIGVLAQRSDGTQYYMTMTVSQGPPGLQTIRSRIFTTPLANPDPNVSQVIKAGSLVVGSPAIHSGERRCRLGQQHGFRALQPCRDQQRYHRPRWSA